MLSEQLATDEVHERESAPLGWWRLLAVLLAVSSALVALSLGALPPRWMSVELEFGGLRRS